MANRAGAPRIEIVYARGVDAGSTFTCAKDSVVIGRPRSGWAVDLDLSPDARVSRPHARIVTEGSRIWIEDLDSKYGTLVNNRNIKGHGRWPLAPDDVIVIGDTRLRVVSGTAPAAADEPAAASPPAAAPVEDLQPAKRDTRTGAEPVPQLPGQRIERLRPGDVVDGFEIEEVLGEGGMGCVYLAMQASPIRRRVALKVIRSAEHTSHILERFRMEQRVLALMNHPHVATVYDAGTTKQGAPYFVMEYVPGVPVTDYCDAHALSLQERVQILREVCLAVEHAHLHGVIHRDLKPDNILVVRQDDRAVPKIIDFGLARSLGPDFGRQVHTEPGQIVGTLEYMAPEQTGLGARVADARADVYALGVILYELLTGTLPFPSEELRQGGVGEMLVKIADVSPPKPSHRVAEARDRSTLAHARRTSIRSLRHELARDLDWVVERAMQKEPEDRYSSASALADDLARYIASRPISARSHSWLYLIGRFLTRWRRRLSSDR